MTSKAYFAISATIFGLVALAHLFRVIYRVPVQVGEWAFPMWLSWCGLVVAVALCVWGFRLLRR